MKRIIILIFVLAVYGKLSSQPIYPTVKDLESTFIISIDSVFGTCFIVSYSGQSYLLTAKHLWHGIKSGQKKEFKIIIDNRNVILNSQIYFHSKNDVDITVIKLSTNIQRYQFQLRSIDDTSNATALGQDCIFLGFPLGFRSFVDSKYYPLTKKATLSGFYTEKGVDYMLLDGHNNKGFSGGPIIAWDHKENSPFIFGIISGYINDPQTNSFKIGKAKGNIVYNENSGIILAFGIRYAIDIIKSIK